jgi:hypothetical protein
MHLLWCKTATTVWLSCGLVKQPETEVLTELLCHDGWCECSTLLLCVVHVYVRGRRLSAHTCVPRVVITLCVPQCAVCEFLEYLVVCMHA